MRERRFPGASRPCGVKRQDEGERNMWKRGLAFAVAALLALGLASPALAQVQPFRDVPKDHWAFDAIERLQRVNLVEGYPDGTFGGDRTFTRYEMAMVFARTLARLEQLIDQRIVDHVSHLQDQIDALRALREQDLADTVAAIEAARAALAEQLGSRIDGLEAELDELKAALQQAGVIAEGAPGAPIAVRRDPSGELQLTPEAEAAIERLIHDRIQEAMAELAERPEVVERLTEVVRERMIDGEVTPAELRRAIEERVAQELQRLGVDEELARAAAAGDPDAVREAVAQLREGAASDVRRLAGEFGDELERLGARVSDLERLFADTSRRVDALEQDFAAWKEDRKTKFSGSVAVEADVRGFRGDYHDIRYDGVAAFLRDPRHDDRDVPGDLKDDEMIFARSRVRQLFNLRADTSLDDNSQLTAEMTLFNNSVMKIRRVDGDDERDQERLGVESVRFSLTGEQGSGTVYYGLLGEDHVGAEGFNDYILDPDRFIEPDPARENHRGTMLQGAFANLRGTALAITRTNYTWKPMDPRDPDNGDERRNFATQPGRRYAASLAADLGATWTIHGGVAVHQPDEGRADTLYSVGVGGPIVKNLRFHALGARDQRQEAWALEAGLGATLGEVEAQFTYGDIEKGFGQTAKDVDDDVRPTFLGNDELSHNHRWILADVQAPLLKGALRGRYYRADRHDDSLDVNDTRVARVDYGVDVPFILPFRLDAAFATGKVDRDAETQQHTKAKLGWEDYKLGESVSWDASVEVIRGWDVKKERHWDDPSKWEKKDKTTFDTTLKWSPWEPVSLYGGYKNVNTQSEDKKEDILTAGIDYGIGLSQYTKLTVGFELQKADVRVAGTKEDRTDRQTLRAAIDQVIGNGGNLRLQAKRISGAGGDGKTKNDAVDHVASLEVRLPVARNVFMDLGGYYVDSRGNQVEDPDKDLRDYTATEVRAGVALQF